MQLACFFFLLHMFIFMFMLFYLYVLSSALYSKLLRRPQAMQCNRGFLLPPFLPLFFPL